MRTVIIKVDSKEAEYIERLDYERGFTKDVLQRIIDHIWMILALSTVKLLRRIRNREWSWMHSLRWL